MLDREERQVALTDLYAPLIRKNWNGIEVEGVTDLSTKGFFNKGVYRVVTKNKDLVLKLHDGAVPVENINRVLNEMTKHEFDNFPFVLATDSGEFSIEHGNYRAILLEWVDGTSYNDLICENKKQKVKTVAATLAKFHSTGDRITDTKGISKDHSIASLWMPETIERFYKVRKWLEEQSKGSNDLMFLIRELTEVVEPFITFYSIRKNASDLEAGLSVGLIHGDFEPQHIIFTSDGNCKFIDFDRFRIGRRLDDLCRLINFGSEVLDRDEIIKSYEKVKTLGEEDKKKLLNYLLYNRLRRLFWILNEHVNRNPKLVNLVNIKKEVELSIEMFS